MKKVSSILAFAFMFLMFFSCSKKDENIAVTPQKYVNAIQGSFIAKDGDITLKAAPLGVTRTWTMYATNSPFYSNQPFALIRGAEFITGSVAYNYWSNPANNPVTFSATQPVYSNLTPDEDLRIISESKDAADKVAYLGILDFKPSAANFPLTVNCFRLGDVLTINADQLTTKPGGDKLSIKVKYTLASIDLPATKLAAVTGTPNVPNGQSFTWANVVYNTPVASEMQVGTGDFVVYEGLDKKVMGDILIEITDTYTGIVNDQPVAHINLAAIQAAGAGKGLKLILATSKIGWYDSGVINFTDKDITVETVVVPVN
jgi:hypothetical protein